MASMDAKCEFCYATNVKLQKCSRCKSTMYCSKDCQRSHWKHHKAICKAKKHSKDSKLNVSTTTAPLRFSQPMSKNSETLANFVVEELTKSNFCVIDGLLTKNTAKEILTEVKLLYESGIFQDGQLSGGLTASEKSEKYTEKKIRSDKLTWIEGNEEGASHIGDLLLKYDSLVSSCSHRIGYDIQGRTKAMVACYPGGGTGYKRHVDNPDGDGRCLTVILYLNDNWCTKDGGVLRIYQDDYNSHIDVEPLFNRVLLFWSDRRNPHEVLPSYAPRFAVTVWYFDQEDRRMAKEKHKGVGQFGVAMAMRDLELKRLERDIAQVKLDSEAEQTVKKLLSDDELDAMAVLITQARDPLEFFTKYGISADIQGALLRVLAKRNTTS